MEILKLHAEILTFSDLLVGYIKKNVYLVIL